MVKDEQNKGKQVRNKKKVKIDPLENTKLKKDVVKDPLENTKLKNIAKELKDPLENTKRKKNVRKEEFDRTAVIGELQEDTYFPVNELAPASPDKMRKTTEIVPKARQKKMEQEEKEELVVTMQAAPAFDKKEKNKYLFKEWLKDVYWIAGILAIILFFYLLWRVMKG